MFNRALAAGIALVLILTCLLSVALVRITDGDRRDYKALLTKANPKANTSPLLVQDRKGVTKEIRSGNHLLKVRCASSSLSISQGGTVEEMDHLEGVLDNHYTFQAKAGTYDYRTHRFTAFTGTLQGEDLNAEAGKIELYLNHWPQEIPRPFSNHIDPEAELILLDEGAELTRGGSRLMADAIWVAQKGGELDAAQTLGKTQLTFPQGYMYPHGAELTCEGNLLLDTHTQTVTTTGDQVHYREERGWFLADQMVVSYEFEEKEPLPTKLYLQGNVRLGSTGEGLPLRQALADEATYLPHTDTLTLESTSGRVLFFDATSDTRISAKKIIAHTKEKAAEGIGGVRCFFHDEEWQKLKEVVR